MNDLKALRRHKNKINSGRRRPNVEEEFHMDYGLCVTATAHGTTHNLHKISNKSHGPGGGIEKRYIA